MVKMLLSIIVFFLFFTFFTTKQDGHFYYVSAANNHNDEIAAKTSQEGIVQNNHNYITVTINPGNKPTITLKTNCNLVSEALKEAGINYTKEDRISPHPDTPLTDGIKIEVVFVEKKIFTEKAILNFQTISKEDKSMPAGSKIIVQEGKQGIVENTIRIYYKNGEETTRGVVSQKILVKPVEEIAIIGTKTNMDTKTLASRGFSSSGSSFKIIDIINMEASAYDPGPISCGPYANGYTCTGIKAGFGVAAVDPSFIPFGTPLYIDGYGYAIAADRGSAIQEDRIDLCYNTYQEAIMFGRKKVKVYILKRI
jgi:3D (Asp-Asp-Asp) domain-containing protein